ncbi:alpha/beta hydrolase fold domain-containing protein [Luteibacter sp. UNCMF366Tsu5.1]|uniref:alpha/beta hydrolase fold domain-containing protein n=1 Tax=Luteibacter sp. UNCMF366Tsu5.1 TaxID=1502758 RepID=UPI000908DBCC|nr:alpha/beta hydrolase fold domain-containing protein [Luteibacter sp. UNCMF366Tsu5.1]SFW67658.1 Acetyl esterase/lipase [Luteibacter sp. UNCMF366Tsu5.1]
MNLAADSASVKRRVKHTCAQQMTPQFAVPSDKAFRLLHGVAGVTGFYKLGGMNTESTDDLHGTLHLEPRQIPLPASISPAARAWMGKQITSEGVARHALMSLPEVSDHSGWKRLQAMSAALYAEMLAGKHGAAGAPLQTIREGATTMHVARPSHPKSEAVYLDIHGGALVFGEGEPCRVGAQQQSELHRLAPDHPYPAALEDCLTAYRFLLARYPAEAIVVGGRSAGGNLAVAMLHRARDEGLPMPSGLVLLSPEVDLTESGDSFQTNRDLDVVLPRSLMKQNLLYAAGHDLAHPSLSRLCLARSKTFLQRSFSRGQETCCCPTQCGSIVHYDKPRSPRSCTYSKVCRMEGSGAARLKTTTWRASLRVLLMAALRRKKPKVGIEI